MDCVNLWDFFCGLFIDSDVPACTFHQMTYHRMIVKDGDSLNCFVSVECLCVQVAFYEILSGMWVRNGLQIKGQAMTYIQCNFCNSMVDADLYLLQICATQILPEMFLTTVMDK